MDSLSIGTLRLRSFAIEPRREGSTLTLEFEGTGDLEAVEPLGAYLDSAFQDMLRLAPAVMRFDFRNLEFMNSSCFKAFVTFIQRTVECDGSPIVFVTRLEHYWQRRSLEALRRLAMGRVTIET